MLTIFRGENNPHNLNANSPEDQQCETQSDEFLSHFIIIFFFYYLI